MANQIKPMDGKICMVTGATTGIGRVTARVIAGQGATMVVVGRDTKKGAETVSEIKRQTGNDKVEFMLADLASQKDIRQLVEQFKARYQQLHVLVNNAGAIFQSRQESPDGIEMTFALNHLNYFLLTNLLLDTLKASAPARIVSVSSLAHRFAKINFDDLQGKKRYAGFGAYSQSKLENIVFTYELARRLVGTNVTANTLHPGQVASNFGKNNEQGFWKLLQPLFAVGAISVEQGAQTSIYLATSAAVEGMTGKYFSKQKPIQSSKASYDETAAKRLWEISQEITGLSVATK